MDRLKYLEEQIVEQRGKIEKINTDCENETRPRNEDEKKAWKEAKSKIEELNDELRDLKDVEEQRKQAAKKADDEAKKADSKEERKAANVHGGGEGKSEHEELLDLSKRFSLVDAMKNVYHNDKVDGVAAELTQEAKEENRSGGNAYSTSGQVVVPAKVLRAEWEARATIDQTNSAIQPTVVGAYVDSIRQNAVFSQVIPARNILTGLTADYKIPAVGSQSLAWATAENSASADGGAQFTKDTLAPVRLTGYADISNRVLLQNGEGALQAVMADFGRETANKIDAALFSTTNVTNAIPAIAATTGVLTFTEAATYAASSNTENGTIFNDYLEALQTLANGNVAPTAFVGSSKLMSDLRKSPAVLGVNSAVIGMHPGAPLRLDMGEGIPFYLTTSNTSNGTTSADFIGGNFNFEYVGFFGGLDMSLDPYSAKLNDEMRVVIHRHVDSSAIRGAAFVKATSLLS